MELFEKPRRARMRTTITLAEVLEDDYVDKDDFVHFSYDSEVLVLGISHQNGAGIVYIVYSEEANEATTIYEGLLDFISEAEEDSIR